jgi:hypothetical protein
MEVIAKEDLLNNFDKFKRIREYDYTNYVSERSCNGGCYGFWTTYTLKKSGRWEISYGTTADFDYCPACGDFGDHLGEDGKYTCRDTLCYEDENGNYILVENDGSFATLSDYELIEYIKRFTESRFCWFEAE